MIDHFTTMNQREHIASLLSQATTLILASDTYPQSAAAPLADAALLLRDLIEAEQPAAAVPGYDVRTSRGGLL